jgi:hypothetical protein
MPYTAYDRKWHRRRFNDLEELIHQYFARDFKQEEKTMATVEELNAAVADLTVSVDAAVAAIGSGATSGIDPADLDDAVAGIKEQAKKLNDAVHAHSM